MYIDDNVSFHALQNMMIENSKPFSNLCLLNLEIESNWTVFSKAAIALYLQNMLKRGAHFTVTRTVDLCFFFFLSFFTCREILGEVCFQWRAGGGSIGLSLVEFNGAKMLFQAGRCHERCDASWKFQLNPLTYEEWHQPVLWHFVVLQNLAHEISKQNEIDGESMWFLTRHDHAYGHKLILLTKMNANITLEFSQYISTAVFDELGNPGNETRKSFMFHNLIKWPDVRFFTHKNICTVQTPEVLMSSYPDIHFWMFRIIITFSGLHATYSINFI